MSAHMYALDVALSVFLFLSSSVMAGRVWRFPFDDELIALSSIERNHSALKLVAFYLKGGDIHPPLSFLLFYGLQHAGFSEPDMRLVSLAMTAVALALFHLLALALAARYDHEAISLPTRLIAVLLFGLSALAVSQGDAIRWYPLFAVLIALFVTLYLAGANRLMRLTSAIPLGLAASTNFLAIVVAVPFALYRYGLQRQFRLAFDLPFLFLAAFFGGLGICSAYSIFVRRLSGVIFTEFGNGHIRALTEDVLGFFGGDALGVTQAWIIVPAVIISVIATITQIDRKRAADPVHLLLLMLAATGLMILPGFAKPRSFLYLAPVLTAVLTLFLNRQVAARNAGAVVLIASLLLAPSVAAITNVNFGAHPFKREASIPYQSIIDFIESNEKGSVLVISTDPVVPWVLRHQYGRDDSCISYFAAARDCLAAKRYDSIFVIAGHSIRSAVAADMTRFNSVVDTITAGRQKTATIHIGVDEDAAVKSRLTGVPLENHILAVDLYR